MNNDLISRDALKANIPELDSYDNGSYVWLKRKDVDNLIDNAPTVSDRYDEGFRDGYAQCINDKEERKENNRLFQKGGAE